jgi:hypothetical protein
MTLHHVCESIEAVWRLGFGRFMSDCLCMSVARTYIRSKADRHPWHGRLLAEAWRPDRGWAGARCFTHVGLFDPWTGPDELGSMQGGVQGAQADGKIYLDSRWSNGPWAAHVWLQVRAPNLMKPRLQQHFACALFVGGLYKSSVASIKIWITTF